MYRRFFVCMGFVLLLSACTGKPNFEDEKSFNSLFTYLQKQSIKSLPLYHHIVLYYEQKINILQSFKEIDPFNNDNKTDNIEHEIEIQKLEINNQKLVITVIIIAFVLILFSLYFYFNFRERKIKLRKSEYESRVSNLLIEAGQLERVRVAADLHDSVNQKLAVIQMYLSTVQGEDEKIKIIGNLINESINDVRNISHNLYASDLRKGLIPALKQLYEQNNFVNPNLKFKLEIEDNERFRNINQSISLVIFRLTQEITNNALKHAKANELTISLKIVKRFIVLNIKDNGIGFDTNVLVVSRGIGLKNMIDRINKINGSVYLSSNPTSGTEYDIRIPFKI